MSNFNLTRRWACSPEVRDFDWGGGGGGNLGLLGR